MLQKEFSCTCKLNFLSRMTRKLNNMFSYPLPQHLPSKGGWAQLKRRTNVGGGGGVRRTYCFTYLLSIIFDFLFSYCLTLSQ